MGTGLGVAVLSVRCHNPPSLALCQLTACSSLFSRVSHTHGAPGNKRKNASNWAKDPLMPNTPFGVERFRTRHARYSSSAVAAESPRRTHHCSQFSRYSSGCPKSCVDSASCDNHVLPERASAHRAQTSRGPLAEPLVTGRWREVGIVIGAVKVATRRTNI